VSSSNGDKQNHSQDGRYAAIYARVSTEDQGKGFSIPTQIEAGQKLAAIATGLDRCEPDDRRLVDAYVAGAFTPQELKGYRVEVTTRRHGLESRRQELLAKQAGLRQTADQSEALITYCARVRARLHTFTVAEKQVVFDALALTIAWTHGGPLRLDAAIPLDGDGIVSNTSARA
jgi:hypothetical protein